MLDKRTQIAAMVLSGVVSDPEVTRSEKAVEFALKCTDALIEELDREDDYKEKIAVVAAVIKTVMAGGNIITAEKRDEMARLIVQQLFNPKPC